MVVAISKIHLSRNSQARPSVHHRGVLYIQSYEKECPPTQFTLRTARVWNHIWNRRADTPAAERAGLLLLSSPSGKVAFKQPLDAR